MKTNNKKAIGFIGAIILLAIIAAIFDAATTPTAPETNEEETADADEPQSQTI